MAAPKGNKFGGGKKGRSGRKSLAVEKAQLENLVQFWNKKQHYGKLKAKITDPNAPRSPKETWHYKVLAGNDKALGAIFDRLYPKELKLKQEQEFTGRLYFALYDDDDTPADSVQTDGQAEKLPEGGQK